ncbi:F-box domain-containing protein/FIST_C domain-containing protein [Cephalotus follicularis]|uniref:F-box domain-containing protein/FIST_C domain-containing protein n=1 Tax=Cephalotus follicularis TaxID=3775 RepID=A0A1Q3BEW4_CEPFO|nr:F-box domain-containing protein/FIST_C domain-containing protein [Cephalotus follicularis]
MSSSSSSRRGGGLCVINEDIVQNIVTRLPATTFASAACVSKTWNQICKRVLSRPKLASAVSLNPSSHFAIEEVLDKVLAEPIRPDFAIASVGCGFDLNSTFQIIATRLGSRTPIILSRSRGVIGRDALNDEFREIKWGDAYSVEDYENNTRSGIAMTIGFVPGLKVDVITLIRPNQLALPEPLVDNFVMDIRNYTMSVSGSTSPVGIIMFGCELIDQTLILEKLDYALPGETVIVGDGKSLFLSSGAIDIRHACQGISDLASAALVFARDRNKFDGIGEIQFHVALSNGVSAIGPSYKAVSVRLSESDRATWLTARREGEQEILDGEQILNNIDNELADRIQYPDLYIGVAKRRKISIGSEKARYLKSLSFHGVKGGDEEYLYAYGGGIKTGDHFKFYHSDPDTALNSLRNVSLFLRNLKLEWNSKNVRNMMAVDIVGKREAFGGFIFSCCGRGRSFFGNLNVDSSPLLENFPGVPLAGIFCGGEVGRSISSLTGQGILEESSIMARLHVYSTVFLLMSYTPVPPDN